MNFFNVYIKFVQIIQYDMCVELFNVSLGIFSNYVTSFKKINKTLHCVFISSNFLFLSVPHVGIFLLSLHQAQK